MTWIGLGIGTDHATLNAEAARIGMETVTSRKTAQDRFAEGWMYNTKADYWLSPDAISAFQDYPDTRNVRNI